MILSMILLMGLGAPGFRQIEHAKMRFEWRIVADRIEIQLSAPTTGWVLVGFNDRPGLDGARLFFTRVRAGQVEAEAHRTDFRFPAPFHQRITRHGGVEDFEDLRGETRGGVTRTAFSVPLIAKGAPHVRLSPGKSIHVIMAWSVSDDFDHHSRMRTGVDLTL